jgi:hypothetical protein
MMKNKDNKFADTILLTGAGFTHNFGGFLSEIMWAHIFNHPLIQKCQNVKNLMIHNYDYESIYHIILSQQFWGKYSEGDREAIKKSVFEAYRQLDDTILNWSPTAYPVNLYGINKLIERFAGNPIEKKMSCFFTLNQDLFIERHFNTLGKPLTIPGVPIKPHPGDSTGRQSPLKKEDFITLPTGEKLEESKASSLSYQTFNYIKLHGSYNWKSSRGLDMLVIGQDKENQISNEPLLSWYF